MAETAHSTPASRRSFLSGLIALPLIGGGVTLLGRPTAAAVPVTDDLLHSYKNWLHFEHRMLSYELAGYDPKDAKAVERSFITGTPGDQWHFQWGQDGRRLAGWPDAPQPSTRAALILSAAGVPLT